MNSPDEWLQIGTTPKRAGMDQFGLAEHAGSRRYREKGAPGWPQSAHASPRDGGFPQIIPRRTPRQQRNLHSGQPIRGDCLLSFPSLPFLSSRAVCFEPRRWAMGLKTTFLDGIGVQSNGSDSAR